MRISLSQIMNFMKGHIQVSVLTATIGGVALLGGSWGSAWLSGKAASDTNESQMKLNISIVDQRENDHYSELNKDLTRIEGKLDKALKQ